jgi:hypothetical protein
MATEPQITTSASQAQVGIATYEERLANDPNWAMSEGSLFFEDKGAVQESLRRIASHLNDLGVPYAIAGGMALFQHGYRRFTEDVDILVTREGLKAIHKALDGRGYVRPFERSKNLRDAQSGIKIEFLVSGEYPGDGKPKAVQFPDPQAVAIERDGIKFLNLSALVELKLASGLTGSDRMKDLADVQELIKLLNLSQDFAAGLSESVRDKYLELWGDIHRSTKRFLKTWRSNPLTIDAKSIEELIAILPASARELEAMRADGIALDPKRDSGHGFLYLVTTDPEVAKKYGMEAEAEFLGDDKDSDDQSE